MKSRRTISVVVVVLALAVAWPIAVRTDDKDQDQQAVQDAVVDFGAPFPQPAGAASHVLVPDDVTISKGGTVTFFVNGGGHGLAIYPVSKNTTRQDIAEDLCQDGPTACAAAAAQNKRYLIIDGKGNLIIDTDFNPPQNRVNDPTERLLATGGGAFHVASTSTATANQVQYRFSKTGRFLVICMNRVHSINDWMFGFVTVVGDDDN